MKKESNVDYEKAYNDLLYQVKANISYLHEKAGEYDISKHDDVDIQATFTGKAFAYRWAAHKLTKSLEWLGIV